jgi:hypothetical protein
MPARQLIEAGLRRRPKGEYAPLNALWNGLSHSLFHPTTQGSPMTLTDFGRRCTAGQTSVALEMEDFIAFFAAVMTLGLSLNGILLAR